MSCVSVVGHSLGARSAFNLEQAIPTAASQIRNASESIVDQHSHLFDSVGYQGLRNLLLIPLRVVGIEVEISMGIRSKVSLVLAYAAGSPLTRTRL